MKLDAPTSRQQVPSYAFRVSSVSGDVVPEMCSEILTSLTSQLRSRIPADSVVMTLYQNQSDTSIFLREFNEDIRSMLDET
jgi:hypothetical protein